MARLCAALLATLFAQSAAAFPVERCINLSNHLEAKREGQWVYPFDPAQIDAMAAVGFDTLRLPVRAADYWDGEQIEPPFVSRMMAVVDRARAAGLFVIVDLHHYNRFVEDPDEFGNEFVAIWQALSLIFKGQEGIAFELLNEPTDAVKTEVFLPYFARALSAIRQHHPDAWVIMGGANYSHVNRLADLPKPDDPRVVHTFHYYTPDKFTLQKPGERTPYWDVSDGRAAVLADIRKAAGHHTSVFLGEFGVRHKADPEDRLDWLETVRRASEAEGIPWCHWGFGAQFGIFDPDSNQWHDEALQALFAK